MYQSCTIVGNVGKDPELKILENGTEVCSFSVAVNNKRKQGDEWIDDVVWFKVTCWNKLAGVAAQYLSKGKRVLVVGRVKATAWNNRETGEAVASLELTAQELKFLSPRDEGDSDRPRPAASADEEDIPF